MELIIEDVTPLVVSISVEDSRITDIGFCAEELVFLSEAFGYFDNKTTPAWPVYDLYHKSCD